MNKSPFTVSLKRVIAVDSADYAYVEVPLDLNVVLLGTGNLGKSSLVNAVRFFLLPEVNLNFADKKFGFISGAGDSADVSYFTKDQIYDHYFPNDNSRLILEVEHRLIDGSTRNHCQIISRAGNYRLQRCFIPEPYNAISYLFWNKVGHAGRRPEINLGNQLLSYLKKINSSTKQIAQVDQLIETLYSVEPLRPERCPFAIFPLNDIRENSVASLRALIKMLFNQDSGSLRLMTATAIEAKDANDQVLELDIGEMIRQQAALRERRSDLNRLKELEPKFKSLQASFMLIKSEQANAKLFAEHLLDLESFKAKIEQQHADISIQKKTVDDKFRAIQHDLQKVEKEVFSLDKRTIPSLKTKLKKHQMHREDCAKICQPFANYSHQEVLETLEEELKEKQREIETYTDASKRSIRLSQLEREQTTKQVNLDGLQKKLENTSHSMQSQLDKQAWEKLYSVNTTLAKANPGGPLSQEQSSVLNNFLLLLEADQINLCFFDEKIPYLKEHTDISLEMQISDVESELKVIDAEYKTLCGMHEEKSLHDHKKIESIEREITTLKNDIEKLKELNNIVAFQKRDEEELQVNIAELKLQKAKLQELAPKIQIKGDRRDSMQSEMDALQQSVKDIEGLLNRFSYAKSRFRAVSEQLLLLARSPRLTIEFLPTEGVLRDISEKLEASEKAKNDIREELRQLIQQKVISDDYHLLAGESTDEAVVKTFQTLANRYNVIDQSYDALKRETRDHNDHVRNRLERLSKTKEKIELAIRRINDDLSKAKVNDLDGVKLDVVLNAHFDDLIDSWREFDDLSRDGTLPEEWYKRLQLFLDSDAVNQHDGKLRMDNIIQKAKYATKKMNEPWDEKDQSTSTKMLINVHFCDIFIKQLSSDSGHVAFPLVMDEIGKVSSEQFPDLIKGLNEKGHWLVGVTTHGKSGQLISHFGHYLIMDELSTSAPYSNKRRHVCYSPELEELTLKDQSSLLESEA